MLPTTRAATSFCSFVSMEIIGSLGHIAGLVSVKMATISGARLT